MKLKRSFASRESAQGKQIAECLEVGSLAICRETTDNLLHLLYQEDIPGLLQQAGYEVREEEVIVPIPDKEFSELWFARYEDCGCEVYLFDGLAVRACVDGIECHVQKNLKPEDLKRIWGDDLDIDWEKPSDEYRLPKDPAGHLAVQIEQLQYDTWDTIYRAPGENMTAEERIEDVLATWEKIESRDNVAIILDEIGQCLSDELDDLSDELDSANQQDREFFTARADDIRGLMERVENLRRDGDALFKTAAADQED